MALAESPVPGRPGEAPRPWEARRPSGGQRPPQDATKAYVKKVRFRIYRLRFRV